MSNLRDLTQYADNSTVQKYVGLSTVNAAGSVLKQWRYMPVCSHGNQSFYHWQDTFTWRAPAGTKFIKFEIWGGGGGGSGGCCCTQGIPGGSGAYAYKCITADEWGDLSGCPYEICVGSGGQITFESRTPLKGSKSFVLGHGLRNFCAEGGMAGMGYCARTGCCFYWNDDTTVGQGGIPCCQSQYFHQHANASRLVTAEDYNGYMACGCGIGFQPCTWNAYPTGGWYPGCGYGIFASVGIACCYLGAMDCGYSCFIPGAPGGVGQVPWPEHVQERTRFMYDMIGLGNTAGTCAQQHLHTMPRNHCYGGLWFGCLSCAPYFGADGGAHGLPGAIGSPCNSSPGPDPNTWNPCMVQQYIPYAGGLINTKGGYYQQRILHMVYGYTGAGFPLGSPGSCDWKNGALPYYFGFSAGSSDSTIYLGPLMFGSGGASGNTCTTSYCVYGWPGGHGNVQVTYG